MSSQKELSDKIGELFWLKEFEPSIHLPIAEDIVRELGIGNPHSFRLSDMLRFESPWLNIDPEKAGRTGEYNVRHIGKWTGSYYLGSYPKLEIVHWKTDVFSDFWDEREELMIAYKGEEVKGLHRLKLITKGFSMRIFGHPIQVRYESHHTRWHYRA